jgi:hypothetical protein
MADTFPLIRWDAVESTLQSAQSIADLNLLRTKMETLLVLSKQSHQSLAMQNKIASYRLSVDRKRGEWLQDHLEWGGDRSGSQSHRVTLKDVGLQIRRTTSARSQHLRDGFGFAIVRSPRIIGRSKPTAL